MSKWSEGAELLQKLIAAKEVIPIQGDLISLQQTMFSLQADQMKLIDENIKLKEELASLRKSKDYIYEEGHKWKIDPDRSQIKLCPVCLNKDGFESPLDDPLDHMGYRYCRNCNGSFN
jgi:hypothetical protein